MFLNRKTQQLISYDDEKAFKFVPLYGVESTSFHRHMISIVVFSYSETLESMLVEYAATGMGFLGDYLDAAPKGKINRGNGITTFLLHVAQCIIFNTKITLKQHLLPMHRCSHFFLKVRFQGY